jgi:hypothetical protein
VKRAKTHNECESCRFECEVAVYETGAPLHEEHKYCDLCAGTMTSRFAHELRITQPSNRDVMQTICHVGNAILAALAKRAANPPQASGEE